MLPLSKLAVASAALLLAPSTEATRVGDEHHRALGGGVFYNFGKTGLIEIIDPYAGAIVKTIDTSTALGDGKAAVTDWGDVVYQRDRAHLNHYIFANDRSNNQVIVIDTETQTIINQVGTGLRPTHAYGLEDREEFWTHPDTDGDFDVIHFNDVGSLHHDSYKVHDNTPGHGKLLFDGDLLSRGFATNTNEPGIFEIDLDDKDFFMYFDLSAPIDATGHICERTHGISYSHLNRNLYIECSNGRNCCEPGTSGWSPCGNTDYALWDSACSDGTCTAENYAEKAMYPGSGPACGGSTWEFNVDTEMAVRRHVSERLSELYGVPDFGIQGQLYHTPDENFVIAASKSHGYIHIMEPVKDEPTETLVLDVYVGGSPGRIRFIHKEGGTLGRDSTIEDYVVFVANESGDASSGFAWLDLADVTDSDGRLVRNGEEVDSKLNFVTVGGGGKYRPMWNGGDFIAIPYSDGEYDAAYAGVGLSMMSTAGDAVIVSDPVLIPASATGRICYAPLHTDEVAYEQAQLEEQVNLLQAEIQSLKTNIDENEDEDDKGKNGVVASLILAVIAVACAVGTLAFVATRHQIDRNPIRQRSESMDSMSSENQLVKGNSAKV